MRDIDRALRLVEHQGHGTATETHDDDIFGVTFRAICIEDGCDWRSGFIPSRSRAQHIGDEHHDKTAGTWKAAR
jgi:hypothetical protein